MIDRGKRSVIAGTSRRYSNIEGDRAARPHGLLALDAEGTIAAIIGIENVGVDVSLLEVAIVGNG